MNTLLNLLDLKLGSVVSLEDGTIGCVLDINSLFLPGNIWYFKFTYLTPSGEIGIKTYEMDSDYTVSEGSHKCYDAIGIMAKLRK